MVQIKVDTGAVRAAQRWVREAAAQSDADAGAVGALFATVGSASGAAAVAAAASEAGQLWSASLDDGTTALKAMAVSLQVAAETYDAAEKANAAGFDSAGCSK